MTTTTKNPIADLDRLDALQAFLARPGVESFAEATEDDEGVVDGYVLGDWHHRNSVKHGEHRVLYKGKTLRDAIDDLMARGTA